MRARAVQLAMMALLRKRAKLLRLSMRSWKRRTKVLKKQSQEQMVMKRKLMVEMIATRRCVHTQPHAATHSHTATHTHTHTHTHAQPHTHTQPHSHTHALPCATFDVA